MNTAKKGRRLGTAAAVIAVGLAVSVVGGIGQFASAGVLDTGFCIGSSGFDGEFTGHHGGKMCDAQPVEEQPAIPELQPVAGLSCVMNGTAMGGFSMRLQWSNSNGAEQYEVKTTSGGKESTRIYEASSVNQQLLIVNLAAGETKVVMRSGAGDRWSSALGADGSISVLGTGGTCSVRSL